MDRIIKADEAIKVPMYSIEIPTIGIISVDDLTIISRLAMCFVVMSNTQLSKEVGALYKEAYNTCIRFLNDNLYF